MEQKIGNQQGYRLSNEQIQVLLTSPFGDGCISMQASGRSKYSTNCINEEYIDFKMKLLGDICNKKKSDINMGYKQNIIHSFATKPMQEISDLNSLPLEKRLSMLDDLGLAMWFYEDGALHKKNMFYNLNTHSFSEEVHRDVLVPYFRNKGLLADVYTDRKKDGRKFFYLYFGKHYGAYDITQLLQKYPIDCYSYKRWPSETIQKWSKLLAQLKSENKAITPRKFENIILGRATL